MAQSRTRGTEFEKAGAQVVLVGMGTPAECAAFLRKFDIPFPMIADARQALYRRFHLQRMSPLAAFSPTVAVKVLAAMARGFGIGKPVGDILQLPGAFVIDSEGRTVFSYQPSGPTDYAGPDTLLQALAAAAATAPR